MRFERKLVGVIAAIPRRPLGASFEWLSEILATQAASALMRARNRAEMRRAIRVRDDAFAAAAHELGNSLGALSLQVRAILNAEPIKDSDSPLVSRLYAMERQVARLIGLNRRMLDSSRLASGKYPLKLEEVDLADVVREVLAREADHLAWRRCPVQYADPGPVVGTWDRGLLDQIFSNLLSNAMKYGHGQPISIALQSSAGKARLEIKDRGIGIAPEDQQRIFQKFERAASIEKGSSLGIGLWLVREVVRALDGSVSVRSAPGVGSTFVVELPSGAPSMRPDGE
jgi:signal transduction histidine kinase